VTLVIFIFRDYAIINIAILLSFVRLIKLSQSVVILEQFTVITIIDRYNPPIKEALLIRQIRFNSVMQQMQSNQRIFNQTIHQMQRSSDMINKSIRDQSARISTCDNFEN